MDYKPHYAFVIDAARCIDCRACLVACSVENKVPMNHTRIWVQDLGVQGEFPNLEQTFVPYNCMHCDNPPCTEVCISGATWKDAQNGLVLVDQDACIGCGFCVEACPYGVRYTNEKRGVVDKCNACLQRLQVGLLPACVTTCLGGSRSFGDINDPTSEAAQRLSNAETVTRLNYVNNGRATDPNIFYLNLPSIEKLNLPGEGRQLLVSKVGEFPHDPKYTFSETVWKNVLVPLMGAAVGGAFLVQAVYYTKQLIEGEKEYEE
jgi:tetrathionate reductase subunit B